LISSAGPTSPNGYFRGSLVAALTVRTKEHDRGTRAGAFYFQQHHVATIGGVLLLANWSYKLQVMASTNKAFAATADQAPAHHQMGKAARCSHLPERLNRFCFDWLLRGRKRTFSPFHRRVVTTDALQVGAAAEGDNRDHSFPAYRAARCLTHEILLICSLTRNWNFRSLEPFGKPGESHEICCGRT
jgi:hypothetical protein